MKRQLYPVLLLMAICQPEPGFGQESVQENVQENVQEGKRGSIEQAENIYERILIARNMQNIAAYENLLAEDASITTEEIRGESNSSSYTKQEYINFQSRLFSVFSPQVSTAEAALNIVNEFDSYSVTITRIDVESGGTDNYSVVSEYSLRPVAQIRVDKVDTYTVRFTEDVAEISGLHLKTTYTRIPRN